MEVETLQNLVTELCVADAFLGVQPRSDGVFLEHRANPEMFTDFPEEVDGAQVRGPVEVVDDAHRVVSLGGQEPANLGFEPPHPLRDRLAIIERTFSRRTRI